MTNLTDVINYDPTIAVPDNGEKVIAVSAVSPPPAGEGPIRPSLQSLANRTAWIRDRLNKLIAGTLSVYGLVVDGVGSGGAVVTPVPGAVSVAKTASSTTLPTSTIAPGTLTKAAPAIAWCGVKFAAAAPFAPILDTAAGAYNIASIDRTAGGGAAGDITITLKMALSVAVPIACCNINGAIFPSLVLPSFAGPSSVRVRTVLTTLVAEDTAFFLVVYGEP